MLDAILLVEALHHQLSQVLKHTALKTPNKSRKCKHVCGATKATFSRVIEFGSDSIWNVMSNSSFLQYEFQFSVCSRHAIAMLNVQFPLEVLIDFVDH